MEQALIEWAAVQAPARCPAFTVTQHTLHYNPTEADTMSLPLCFLLSLQLWSFSNEEHTLALCMVPTAFLLQQSSCLTDNRTNTIVKSLLFVRQMLISLSKLWQWWRWTGKSQSLSSSPQRSSFSSLFPYCLQEGFGEKSIFQDTPSSQKAYMHVYGLHNAVNLNHMVSFSIWGENHI